MYELIDFYEASSAENAPYERGQFWWTCFPYAPEKPTVTRFWPNRQTRRLNVTTFDPSKEETDEAAQTAPGEFLAIAKFKRRPVLILSSAGISYQDRAWHGGEWFLVAPVRSLRDDLTGEYKCAPEFVWKVITYKYTSLFYLPKDSSFDIHEAILQFDRITALHISWLIEPRKVRLTDAAQRCVDEWMRGYIFGKVSRKFYQDLEAYQAMVGEDPQIRTGVFGPSGV